MTDDLRDWYKSKTAHRPKSYNRGQGTLAQAEALSVLAQLQEAVDEDTQRERGGVCSIIHRDDQEVAVPFSTIDRPARARRRKELGRRNCDPALAANVVGHTIPVPGLGEIGCCTKAIDKPGFAASPKRKKQIKNERKRARRAAR